MILKKRILPLLLTLVMLLPCIAGTKQSAVQARAASKASFGVDISSYNGDVDWPLMAGNDISFVILRGGKLTSEESDYYEDDHFDQNYEEARRVGLKIGAYIRCGATSQEKFEEAITAFIATIEGKRFDYPVFIDVEEAEQQKLEKEVITQYVLDGLKMIEDAGFRAGVYANRNWYTNILDQAAIEEAGYPLWLARYTHDCTAENYSEHFCIWQYSNKGQLPGNGKGSEAVDLNISYVDFNYQPDLYMEQDPSYDGCLPLHTYLREDASVTPRYADCKTEMDGTVTPSTECQIREVYTNGWCRVAYKTDAGRRIGYLPLSTLSEEPVPDDLAECISPGNIPTYIKSDMKTRAGHLDRRDLCRILSETDDAVQLVYPVGSGCKIAWVSRRDWEIGYLSLLQDYVLAREYLTEEELLRVDCNDDGIADVFDLGLMRRNLLKYGIAKPASAVDQRLAEMTLQEKIYQLFIVTPEGLIDNVESCVTASGSKTKTALQERPVGGIIYFAQNLKSGNQTKAMIENAQTYAKDSHKTGLFIAVDEEGGRVARVAKTLGTTEYDPMATYGAKGDTAAVREIGRDIAADIAQFGFNLDFAPVADVNINSGNELGDRIFSSDPAVVAAMSAAMVEGLQESGAVSATLKHFPGLGAEDGNTHYDKVCLITRSFDQLKEAEFVAFRGGIDAGADFVMVGHHTVSCAGDGLPSDLSGVVITDWLRGELGYNGLVLTDAQNMKTITLNYTPGEAAKMSIMAGADIVLMPTDTDAAFEEIYKAVRSGEIPESRIDQSVRRILKVKEKHGLL